MSVFFIMRTDVLRSIIRIDFSAQQLLLIDITLLQHIQNSQSSNNTQTKQRIVNPSIKQFDVPN